MWFLIHCGTGGAFLSGFAGATIVVFVFIFAKVGVVLDTANITDTAIAEKMRYLNSVLLDRGQKQTPYTMLMRCIWRYL